MLMGERTLDDLHGSVSVTHEVSAGPVPIQAPSSLAEARREIETLRSINTRLLRQVQALQQREAHVQGLADRDGLTGLYNRRKMLELLDRVVGDASLHDQCVGVLFIDLDGFKTVNDRYGHAAGDKLLQGEASRLSARARTGDFVCRYGGDEFVVILPRVADRAAVYEVAERICERVSMPYWNDGIELNVTASVGLSLYPDEAFNASDLMENADASMYLAKSSVNAATNPVIPSRRRDDFSAARFLSVL